MRVKDLTALMDRKFPLKLQEHYDNAGAQLIFSDDEVTGVLLALDADPVVTAEAAEKNCNLIVTHHPFFFRPLKKIIDSDPKSSLLLRLAAGRVSVYSSHTNLDKVYHGMLSETLGYPGGSVLLESEEKSAEGSVGFGARIDLAEPVTLGELLARVKEVLGLGFLVYCGDERAHIKRIAFLNGAGGGAIDRIMALHGPQCIITGDVGYHHLRGALDRGAAVIDAGHFGTERIYLPFLKKDLEEMMRGIRARSTPEVFISEGERNPFRVFL